MARSTLAGGGAALGRDEHAPVTTRKRRIVASCGTIATLVFGVSALGAGAASGLVTIAGSGRLGFADGPALTASFIAPSGIARGPDGTVYVADTGAQRVRAIHNGSVVTIAGSGALDSRALWVYGGFQNGSAASARFDDPHGIAVDAQGRIYVADTDNSCIRLIDHGVVSTYAGACGYSGNADGKAQSARFHEPYQLALGSDGALYVADFGNGVREITSDGTVSTIYRSISATGVAISPSGRVVFAADQLGLAVIRDGATTSIHSLEHQQIPDGPNPLTPPDVGHPYEIAAIDNWCVLYTDVRSGAIHYFDVFTGNEHTLVGSEGSDPLNTVAGFRDGPLNAAMVWWPVGLTDDGHGAYLVADTGNRRVRRLAVNLRSAVFPARGDPMPPPLTGASNVAFVGNSIVYDATLWDDSIEGRFEQRASARGHRVRAQAFMMGGSSLSAILQYVDLLGESHVANEVVLFLDSGLLLATGKDWEQVLAKDLTASSKELAASGIKLVVVYHPDAYDLQWGEYPHLWANYAGKPVDVGLNISYARVSKDLRDDGLRVVDLWPLFLQTARSPAHVPLYGTTDAHLSVEARSLVADALAKALLGGP